jgi:hypothetical protein
VTVDGAGRKDGSDWENAFPGGGLQRAWDGTPPGGSLLVGSGTYRDAHLEVSTGGTGPRALRATQDARAEPVERPRAWKSLVGVDTGAGAPVFVGDWKREDPKRGPTFIDLKDEVDYCRFENLAVRNYQRAVFSRHGRHTGLRFRNVDVRDSRFGIWLYGLANRDEAELATHDVEIRDCEFVHFTKSAVRLEGGNHDVRVIDCLADAGGEDWMKEAFQICYNVRGSYSSRRADGPRWADERDIMFVNCVAKSCVWSRDRYWQGDGFCVEGGCSRIAFVSCLASDCADGGWDVKSSDNVFVNCVALRCKFNMRIWREAFMFNCLSAHSYKHGGSWTSAGLWTPGELRVLRSTFCLNSRHQILADKKRGSTARVTLENCIVAFDSSAPGGTKAFGNPERVTTRRSVVWDRAAARDAPASRGEEAGAAGDPGVTGPRSWNGTPADEFDSARFGSSKGFHSSVCLELRSRPAEELVSLARSLLDCEGRDEFRRRLAESLPASRR